MSEGFPQSAVLLGVTWNDGSARVRVAEAGALESIDEPLVGFHLGYRTDRSAGRRCLGRTSFREGASVYVHCDARPAPGSRSCERCAISAATFAANVHHAHTRDREAADPAYAEHLRKPNVLYLAAFRDGSIKIGTSSAGRTENRLAEQGAWTARVVAHAVDGYVVRVVEDLVTAELDIAQAIAARRKLDGLVSPVLDERLGAELDRLTKAVHDLIATMDEPGLTPTAEPWHHPRAHSSAWQNIHPYPLDLATGRHDVEVIDALGRFVAVTRPGGDDVFAADLQRIYGVELELGAFGSDELAVQDALF